MSRKWAAALTAVLSAGAVMACAPGEASNRNTESSIALSAEAAPETQAAVRLMVAPQGNEARYRVREQLLGVDFPNDAVGATTAITGTIAFGDKGNIAGDSRIVVNVTGLKSDKERRDGFLQRNTLQTTEHPNVVLVPKSVRGVSFPLPTTGTRTIELTGDLTVRGVTRPTTWRGQASFDGSKVTGSVSTTFQFPEFQLEKPRVRSVLSVEDDIKLEYDFMLVPVQ